MQEKFRDKGKKPYYGFVDLEKAFGRVQTEVIRWAMHKYRQSRLCTKGSKTVVRTVYHNRNCFEVMVGMQH